MELEFEQLAKLAFDAVTSKDWFVLASVAVLLLAKGGKLLATKYGRPPFLKTPVGEAVLVAVLAAGGGLLNAALAPGATFTLTLFIGVLKVALPPLLMVLLGQLFRRGDSAATIEAAKAAGATAAAEIKPKTVSDIVNDK